MKTAEIFNTGGLRALVEETPDGLLLKLIGRGTLVWPNREGEGFSLDRVFPALKTHGCLESGLSLSWPATAMTPGCLFFNEEGAGIFFRLKGPGDGIHICLRIFSSNPGEVSLRFSGGGEDWTALPYAAAGESPFSAESKKQKLQFQLGLFGPDGKTEVTPDEGFAVIPRTAERIRAAFGPFQKPPLIHLFGIGAGHDRAYPDYSPNALLGGEAVFRRALEETKALGFRISCYLNARIIDAESLVVFPELRAGVCRGGAGDTTGGAGGIDDAVVEVYHGRRFYVMDPNFEPWLDVLYRQALMLRELGADVVQLDQVAGRAAAVPSGVVWGRGYRALIRRMQAAGLQVWIQGVSDYYPADWFEMTWREVNILPDGILRGGNPFGSTDLRLLKTMGVKGPFLVPRSKAEITRRAGLEIILDVLGDQGRLPLYGAEYLEELEQLAAEGLWS